MQARPKITVAHSFYVAGRGLLEAVGEQRSLKIHLAVGILVIAAGFWLKLTGVEWAIVTLCIGVMFTVELLNTAIEMVVDLASPDIHELARKSKDFAAAAVFSSSIMSATIGVVILLPKLWAKLS